MDAARLAATIKRADETFRKRSEMLLDADHFARTYLGFALNPFQKRLDELVKAHTHTLVQGPPGHGKTDYLGLALPLMILAHDRNARILYGSKTATLAINNAKRIKMNLESNRRMIRDFGEFMDEGQWTSQRFAVRGRDPRLKDPSVVAFGTGEGIEGVRATHIILDDPIDQQSMDSEVVRESIWTWFTSTVLERLDPGGRIIIVGHRWHYQDLYARIEKLEQFESFIVPAIADWDKQVVLWPAHIPFAKLMEVRDAIGSVMFELKYQQSLAALLEDRPLRLEWYQEFEAKDQPAGLEIYEGWDLAITEKDTGCYTACTTVGVSRREGKLYVLDCWKRRMDFPSQVRNVIAMFNAYHPRKVGIEDNAYQRALVQQATQLTGYPVVGVTTDKNMDVRMRTLAPHLEAGRIVFRKGLHDLLKEYSQYPDSDHDDMLSSLDIAVRASGFGAYGRSGGVSVDMGQIMGEETTMDMGTVKRFGRFWRASET